MKLKYSQQYRDNDELEEITLSRLDDCLEHNHILKYIDVIKINDAVKFVVAHEVFKEYVLAIINRLLKGTK